MIKAIRGAIAIEKNEAEAIYEGTKSLLLQIVEANNLAVKDIVNITFSATTDLTAAYPAKALRDLGWINVPMLCVQEMNVPGSLPFCLRVMLLANWDKEDQDVKHVYLGEAKNLRPDL